MLMEIAAIEEELIVQPGSSSPKPIRGSIYKGRHPVP